MTPTPAPALKKRQTDSKFSLRQLIGTYLSVAVLMALYELAKETIFKGQLTLWESHTITVIVTACFATITAHFIRARTNTLNRELQEAHNQAADIIDNMFDAVIIIDKQGFIAKFNPAAEMMFGIPSKNAIGKSFTTLLDDDFAIEYKRLIQDYIGDKNSPALSNDKREVLAKRSSGEIFPADLITSSMVLSGQLMFLGVARDTTESKNAEKELARLRQIEHQIHENLKKEISIAASIQMNMIPSGGSLFPDHQRIKAYGITKPAKEMGGDFYDAFAIDGDHIVFAVGDVSGKGVPAALFMMKIMTILRSSVTNPAGLKESMLEVNRALCHNNESNMFVTMFIGILNIHTGYLEYVNAGHDAPLIANNEMEFAALSGPRNMILGIHEATMYNIGSTYIKPGDTVVVYTDGVTEAENHAGELYSLNRFKALLSKCERSDSKIIVDQLLQDIDRHVESISQSDDITVLALQYH